MALMSCCDIDFVAFHRAAERHLGRAFHDPFAQLRGHLLDIITIKVQFLSNLFIREIQPHEVEAGDPGAQRPVVPGEDRPGQVIEASATGRALVLLPRRLGLVVPLFGDLGGGALRTGHPVGPAHLADGLEALDVVDEVQDVQDHSCMQDAGNRKRTHCLTVAVAREL
jgi:hypothetical protein